MCDIWKPMKCNGKNQIEFHREYLTCLYVFVHRTTFKKVAIDSRKTIHRKNMRTITIRIHGQHYNIHFYNTRAEL